MKTAKEIYEWLNSKGYQKERGEQEYFMYFDIDMPKILNAFLNEFTSQDKERIYELEKIVEILKKNALFNAACVLPDKDAEYETLKRKYDAITSPIDKWVSVEEIAPSKSGLYLTILAETEDQYIAYYKSNRNTFEIYGLGRVQPVIDMNVTHWQPLPNPPTK